MQRERAPRQTGLPSFFPEVSDRIKTRADHQGRSGRVLGMFAQACLLHTTSCLHHPSHPSPKLKVISSPYIHRGRTFCVQQWGWLCLTEGWFLVSVHPDAQCSTPAEATSRDLQCAKGGLPSLQPHPSHNPEVGPRRGLCFCSTLVTKGVGI